MDDTKRSTSLTRRIAVAGTILLVAVGGTAPAASAASAKSPNRVRTAKVAPHIVKTDHLKLQTAVAARPNRAR